MLWLALLLLPPSGVARAVGLRRMFEPTDLDFEDVGSAEFDMEFGLVRGQDQYRVSLPDFEFDLGLSENVELDVDGEFALGGPPDGELRIDRLAQDNLWVSLKYRLLGFDQDDAWKDWAAGLQVGPVLPVAPGAQGTGVEGLALLSYRLRDDSYLALNLGGLSEPGDDPGQPRASSFVGGLNLLYALDADAKWSLTAQLGGSAFWSPDDPQLTTTLGLQWSVCDSLDLSITGLRGWLRGGDQFGVLLGVSPTVALW